MLLYINCIVVLLATLAKGDIPPNEFSANSSLAASADSPTSSTLPLDQSATTNAPSTIANFSNACEEAEYDLPVFRLKGGKDDVDADLHTLRIHQENIKKGIKNSTMATASAISGYLAAIANATDHGLIARMCTDIHSFLLVFPCTNWELDFTSPAEYRLCNCFHLTTQEWTDAKDENSALHPLNQSQALFAMASKAVHRCNKQFGWSLLDILFVRHGIQAGMNVFRNEDFNLFYDALEFRNQDWFKNSSQAGRYTAMMDQIEENLHEERAEIQYHKLDLILKSLNNMKSFKNDTWLYRLRGSMNAEYELVQAMKEQQKNPSKLPPTSSSSTFILIPITVLILIALALLAIVMARKHQSLTNLFQSLPFSSLPTNLFRYQRFDHPDQVVMSSLSTQDI